jgi:hypothetical protein
LLRSVQARGLGTIHDQGNHVGRPNVAGIVRWRCALQSAESPEAGGDMLQELLRGRKAFSKIAPTVFLK